MARVLSPRADGTVPTERMLEALNRQTLNPRVFPRLSQTGIVTPNQTEGKEASTKEA